MSEYYALVKWERRECEAFIDGRYSRGHTWGFDGGLCIPASSSPHIVPLPFSVEQSIDPEEAFVASISSCHMLFFLSIAAKRKYIVKSYVDDAIGVMAKDDSGKTSITKVTLRPKVVFEGDLVPSKDELENMHHVSHEQCFIANSVKSAINIEMIF